MTSPTADRIIRALIVDQDPHLAGFIVANIDDTADLRALVLELAAIAPSPQPRDIDMDNVLALAARAFGTTIADILTRSQRHEVLKARQVACYAGHLLGHSHSAMGRFLGRDHTSVMAAVAKVGVTPNLRAHAERIARAQGWDRNDAQAC